MKIWKAGKAQTGMEYLMTYGWAMLIVGIIVLLLMSLKVFDANFFNVSNECWMFSSFGIPDFKVTPHPDSPETRSVIIFQMINNRGTNITVSGITLKDQDGNDVPIGFGDSPQLYVWQCPVGSGTCTVNATAFPFNMTAGQRFIVNGTMEIPGDMNLVFTTKLAINYTSPRSDVIHTETGMCRGRIEPP